MEITRRYIELYWGDEPTVDQVNNTIINTLILFFGKWGWAKIEWVYTKDPLRLIQSVINCRGGNKLTCSFVDLIWIRGNYGLGLCE